MKRLLATIALCVLMTSCSSTTQNTQVQTQDSQQSKITLSLALYFKDTHPPFVPAYFELDNDKISSRGKGQTLYLNCEESSSDDLWSWQQDNGYTPEDQVFNMPSTFNRVTYEYGLFEIQDINGNAKSSSNAGPQFATEGNGICSLTFEFTSFVFEDEPLQIVNTTTGDSWEVESTNIKTGIVKINAPGYFYLRKN